MEARQNSAGNRDEKDRDERLPTGMRGKQRCIGNVDQVGAAVHQYADEDPNCRDNQKRPKDRVYASDDRVNREQSSDNIINKNTAVNDPYNRIGECRIGSQEFFNNQVTGGVHKYHTDQKHQDPGQDIVHIEHGTA